AKLAGLYIDSLQKMRQGQMTLKQLDWFNGLTFADREACLKQPRDDRPTKSKTKQPSSLFGPPLLEQQVIIPENFSLDKNIVPDKEFVYNFITPEMRDKKFKKQTLSGPATLKIVATTKDATTQEIAEATNQDDAFAIVAVLQAMLIKDPHSLDAFKDRAIFVPVLSVLPDALGDLFCLGLDWNGRGWCWGNDWVGDWWKAGVHVASVAQ
ncbi:MAG: hypothetical protein V1765_02620, partial [bacterium]